MSVSAGARKECLKALTRWPLSRTVCLGQRSVDSGLEKSVLTAAAAAAAGRPDEYVPCPLSHHMLLSACLHLIGSKIRPLKLHRKS